MSIDSVLPLRLVDWPRARLLLASLGEHVPQLGTVHVVAPAAELSAVNDKLNAHSGLWPNFRVLSELEVVPELSAFPGVRGWYKQQLIKLAIHTHVTSESYLTLDADVLCTRRFTEADILDDQGRTPCHIERSDLHPDWYEASRRVLGITGVREPITHNVTPAMLSVPGVALLSETLNRRFRSRDYAQGVQGVVRRFRLRGVAPGNDAWRSLLAVSTPWTEYALYYSCLAQEGAFEAHHYVSSEALYASAEGSIWRGNAGQFAHWDPSPLFTGDGPPFFVIVQSNAGIPAEAVQSKFAPHLKRLSQLPQSERVQ